MHLLTLADIAKTNGKRYSVFVITKTLNIS